MPKRSGETPGRQPGRAEATPEVILDVVVGDGLCFLCVRNISAHPAYDVRMDFDAPIIGLEGNRDLTTLPLFRHLTFLAPGREIRAFVDTSASYFARRQPTEITVRITYRDASNRRYVRTIRHDLEIYRHLGYVTIREAPTGGDP